MEEKLKEVFENVNSWLKFAESKNAALVVFNSAAGFGLASLLADAAFTPPKVHAYVCFCVFLLGIGAFIGLISFLPQLRIPWFFANCRIDERDNLLFFGHIARYTADNYLTALSKCLGVSSSTTSATAKDYAGQIIINSQITVRKHLCFTVGLWFTLTSLATPIAPVIGLIIYLINRRKKR